MRSIFGSIVNMSGTYKRAIVLGGSGWRGGYKRTNVRTGYHKLMPLADRRELAFRLQREAAD